MPNLRIEVDGEVVELPEEVVQALTEIAQRNGLRLEEAIQQAIVNEKFIEDEVEGGAKLLIEKNDELRHLDLEPA